MSTAHYTVNKLVLEITLYTTKYPMNLVYVWIIVMLSVNKQINISWFEYVDDTKRQLCDGTAVHLMTSKKQCYSFHAQPQLPFCDDGMDRIGSTNDYPLHQINAPSPNALWPQLGGSAKGWPQLQCIVQLHNHCSSLPLLDIILVGIWQETEQWTPSWTLVVWL